MSQTESTVAPAMTILNNELDLVVEGMASVGFSVAVDGGWNGTIAFEYTMQVTGLLVWNALTVTNVATAVDVASTVGSGNFRVNVASFARVRARISVFVAGTAAVTIQASESPSVPSLGGGGGGGSATAANQTNGTQIASAKPRSPSTVPALATSQILRASAGTLFGISVQTGTGVGGADTMPTGTYWLILTDLAAAPAPGAVVPITAWQVDHTLGVRDTVELGDEVGGLAMAVGATLLLSTTGPAVYTASGAYMLATASVSS